MRLRKESALLLSIATAIVFFIFGKEWLSDLSNLWWTAFLFLWLFSVMLMSSFAVVRHADCLAIKLGEPYGTLILTLAVISIEVIMISAVMLTGEDNPELGRDMMFSVLMIVLNGLAGFSLLLGSLRHDEQDFNLSGANTYLTVLIPLAVLGLILPNYTASTAVGTYSGTQMAFLFIAALALYSAFLAIQTVHHQEYFRRPASAIKGPEDSGHGDLEPQSVPAHAILLMAYMIPIVLLSKQLAVIIDYGIAEAAAPVALGGFLVAILVLTPEGLAAIRAAMADNLQRSINICLGSALATIGLTIPAVLAIGLFTGEQVILGLNGVDSVLLLLTFAVSVVNFSSARSNYIQGVVHIILFLCYLIMLFD